MSNYYNLDGIQTEIKREIARYTALLAAWEKVTFPTKKDGTPFKNMAQNISGAKFSKEWHAMQPGENVLTVYTQARETGYIDDELKLYGLVRYMKDETMLAKTQNYQPKQSFLEQVYAYDLDDIKKAVADRIEYLKKYIADLESQLEQSEKIYIAFRDAYRAAMETLEKETEQFTHKNLFYAIRDTVKERHPYA